MILALLLALQIAAPADVTVTGTRPPNPCATRSCPIREDVQASVAEAEAAFMAGGYLDSKRLLQAAVGRQRRNAAADPVAMGTLYQALATVSLHDGDMVEYRAAAGEQLRVTRAHLPPGHPAVTNAEFGAAQMWTKLGFPNQARRLYAGVADRLAAAGNQRLAMLTGMRAAWLADVAGDKADARKLLAKLEAQPAAADPEIARALRVVALRIAGEGAKPDTLDALAARIAQDPPAVPTLVFAPPIPTRADDADRASRVRWQIVDTSPKLIADPHAWADVGFHIRPDGSTADAEVLRGSKPADWTGPALAQIAARRYSPYAASPGSAGVYRVERLTQRATRIVPVGSRVPQRVGPVGIETLNLSETR